MEHKIGKRGGDAAGADVEGELDGSGTIGIEALRHHRDGAENQGLRETELEHSDQDEKEIDREVLHKLADRAFQAGEGLKDVKNSKGENARLGVCGRLGYVLGLA